MRKLSVYLTLCILLSCTKNEDVENVYNVPVEFKLDLTQALSDQGAIAAFEVSVIGVKGCPNQDLVTLYNRFTTDAFIKILGIKDYIPCGLGEEIISSTVKDSFPKGAFNLNVQIRNDVENTGTFIVNDHQYNLTMHSTPNIQIGQTDILKLPSNILWGYYYFEDEVDESLIYKLENLLTEYTNVLTPTIGDYGLFKVDENEVVRIEPYSYKIGYRGIFHNMQEVDKVFLHQLREILRSNPKLKLELATDKKVLISQ